MISNSSTLTESLFISIYVVVTQLSVFTRCSLNLYLFLLDFLFSLFTLLLSFFNDLISY